MSSWCVNLQIFAEFSFNNLFFEEILWKLQKVQKLGIGFCDFYL